MSIKTKILSTIVGLAATVATVAQKPAQAISGSLSDMTMLLRQRSTAVLEFGSGLNKARDYVASAGLFGNFGENGLAKWGVGARANKDAAEVGLLTNLSPVLATGAKPYGKKIYDKVLFGDVTASAVRGFEQAGDGYYKANGSVGLLAKIKGVFVGGGYSAETFSGIKTPFKPAVTSFGPEVKAGARVLLGRQNCRNNPGSLFVRGVGRFHKNNPYVGGAVGIIF